MSLAVASISSTGMKLDRFLKQKERWKWLSSSGALYNFHSTFSGTHFVAPRTYSGAVGFIF
jgi:hypothetical protein